MDTYRIKRFATEARNILKTGIAAKIITLGFDKKGNVPELNRPQLMQGGCLWNGQLQTEGFYYQWMSLYSRVQQKGINEVYEEAAYTWFNRLCAIRILQKNNLCSPVLKYADSARTPIIVDEARQGHLPQMKEEARQRLIDLLEDDTKVTEQFAVLITAWCHANPIVYKCFGGMADFTELLLPNNILAEGGFVDLLNHTDFITDEDFRSPELIGWLYQFYISERKDEVFAKKGKFEADEIPAATQIFTPNWIVKYMVQNTVGRMYLDNHLEAASVFKPKWQYLVDNENDNENQQNICKFEELTDLVCGDLACGSGHIENEMFDVLFDLYMYEGYSRSEAIENIFRHNLVGIDLDLRAKQLATFALLLKACQKDESFADAHCMPNILTMLKPWDDTKDGDIRDFLHHYFQGQENRVNADELADCFDLMQNADSLGSIMKFNISDSTRLLVKQTTEYWCGQEIVPEAISAQIPAFKLILALTEKYHALVMNPPYMKLTNMNESLTKYVKEYYSEGQADLCTTFMLMESEKTLDNGFYANIIPPSWMFLGTFENLRTRIIKNNHITTFLHLSRGVFGADFGSVSFTIKNSKANNQTGVYFRLIERTFQEFDQIHLQQLFEKTLANHNFKYNFKEYSKSLTDLVHSDNGKRIYYPNINQDDFLKIPGTPFGYWLNETVLNAYMSMPSRDVIDFKTGITTGDNPRFTRFWSEVSSKRTYWELMRSGSSYRKWYGSLLDVVYWKNDGELIKSMPNSTMRNSEFMYKPAITWSKISSGDVSVRYSPQEILFDAVGLSGFAEDDTIKYGMALYNSKVGNYFIRITNSSMSILTSDLGKIPYIENSKKDIVSNVDINIGITHKDWDSHEISIDFQTNELIRVANGQSGKLDDFINDYRTEWEQNFDTLHENEEELNRQFIEIYGLQDELTPDVPLSEITILQAGEITHVKDENEYGGGHYVWNYDNLMKQLISYAVGTWMGRYRLDKPGLHIAHPDPTEEEIAAYEYHGDMYEIDDDAIIPLMPNDCGFSDNASLRFSNFIRQVFGDDNHVENLNYVEQCLGKTVEQYFVKDFWKDHKKMYQNRPIYWLFSSKKGAFQVITYMHRMNAYTVERIRAKYLLPYIEHLQTKIADLDSRAASLSSQETRQMQKLQDILEECREYHERLQVVAEQAIGFDLDDGVVVNYAKFGDVVAKIK